MDILIVGAGPSGLAALKEMREAGFDAVAVDTRSSFGGVFAPDSGVTFDGLHLTISNLFMSYSDFPAPDVGEGVKYWSQQEYFDYLTEYVEHFGLGPHIRLQTEVEAAHFDHTRGRWDVRLLDRAAAADREAAVESFDKLIVASGANHTPRVPEFLERFDGPILHSADYHRAEQVAGKRVLVVGMGEGAADVASSAAKTAKSVTVWGRRFPDCAPRFVQPFLHDEDYDEHEHLPQHHKPNGVLESLTITRAVRNLPLGLWSVALHGLTKDMAAKHGPNSMQGMARAMVGPAWSGDYYSSDTSMVPTKSGITLTAAARRELDVVIAPSAAVTGRTVSFSDAQVFGAGGNGSAAEPTRTPRHDVDFDLIVACTGFGLNFEWISSSDPSFELSKNPRTWFKHCFAPGMGESLAFVGFARPHSGGIPQCSEMISRYIAQLYLGNVQLPRDYPELALAEGAAEEACFNLTPDYTMLVDYMAYMMSVAKLIGCTPRKTPPGLAPRDAVKYWTFPLWPCFFRTQGVGAKPAAAQTVLQAFDTFDALTPMPLLALQIACGFAMPFVNATSLAADTLFPKATKRALPRLYRWRLSKMHFLYHNSLTVDDFAGVATQWAASSLMLAHVVGQGVRNTASRLGRVGSRGESAAPPTRDRRVPGRPRAPVRAWRAEHAQHEGSPAMPDLDDAEPRPPRL